MGLARVVASVSLAMAVLGAAPARGSNPDNASPDAAAPVVHVELWADRDDDDANGEPDGEQVPPLPPAALVDLVPVDGRLVGAVLRAVAGGEHVRIVADKGGHVVPWGTPVPVGALFQGITAGHADFEASTRKGGIGSKLTIGTGGVRVSVDVSGLGLMDGEGKAVDLSRSHASLERTPPGRLEGGAGDRYDDFDALRVVITRPGGAPGADAPPAIAVESVSGLGVRVDVLPRLGFAASPCAGGDEGLRCWTSAPLRPAMDDVDRNHPLVADRSIKAEVGGAIVFRHAGRKAQMVRVLGPRTSPVGPIGRLRATLRPFVVRVAPGGAPSIGGTDAGAIEALRGELGSASAIWGQCGLTFGDPRTLEVHVIDPPPSHLVAIGDDLGLPASGGQIQLRVDGRPLAVTTFRGERFDRIARDLARAAERAGLTAVVSANARIGPAAGSSIDVSLRHKDGTLAAAEVLPGQPLSTDPTLGVRIGSVDMAYGLRHFTDVDAMAGTIEERTLLKAIDDADPTTIEIVVVPLFAGGGRIGESFIASDLSSVRNVVVLDRAGIRARKSSLTLSHELGHVLMDLPGHPDDYGMDTPTRLMDSDAADASPFGPRRLTLDECARVVRQAGPDARLPLLVVWPIGPIPASLR
jgi:hypothetical protein